MKERPLLFNGDMVCAILQGSKSETRRLRSLDYINKAPDNFFLEALILEKPKKDLVTVAKFKNLTTGELVDIPCPYGQPGDLLWVRETWRQAPSDDAVCFAYKADMSYKCSPSVPELEKLVAVNGAWKPSIHMPKQAARIWLEILNIRVEKLWDINQISATREGVEKVFRDASYNQPARELYKDYHSGAFVYTRPRTSFQSLWESVNGANSWAIDPWIWVVEFKKCDDAGT
ncbi:hypothetical protein VF04_04415 [Nostoc linckia z7]|uniref:ASCH domain-containing protein n=2 Tax=Nostoc linckia TaxID=92942 RepID=A0A9Q5ZGI6_NOSLI|nr:hypothetical protein [Nostoc linckia]PHK42955.1 hypothetical protein VF12_01115 [Nostoc linckia z15]PHK48112.1 hypothetical protein VF13_02090 [Nostoc linckia z16]PHJ65032.1 hypothetical protein VF02_11900 [Nostoc linckia z1]PHJ70073.1 hypothetical protein VF05_11295 [Nostoc linckia z3]PHJ75111.1 hypothetical protein VF03_12220 [Nostoc linckia z2]